jgi:SP family myo-inositol transporter-like MFS transporter 13
VSSPGGVIDAALLWSNLSVIDDTGVISATLVSIDSSLSGKPLSSLDKSIITSSTALFALLISPFSSVLADSFGRKRVILMADALFILGAGLQAISSTVASMVAGRSIVGAAVGAASFVVPLYIAELAPAAHRGRLVTMNIVFITLGQVVAYIVGWIFGEYGSTETGWRWMVGLGAVPAALQTAIVLFMPETPRWLVKAGRSSEARVVIQKVSGGKRLGASSRAVDATLKNIEIEVREEAQARRRRTNSNRPEWLASLDELFRIQRNRRALAIACLLQGLQQLCGFVSAYCTLVCLNFADRRLLELAHVLLGYHLHYAWISHSDAYIASCCGHQLCLYCRSPFLD